MTGSPELVGAAGLFRRAYNSGVRCALVELAAPREKEGDLRGAERIYRRALDEGHEHVAREIVRIMETTGRTKEADELTISSYWAVEELARIRAAKRSDGRRRDLVAHRNR